MAAGGEESLQLSFPLPPALYKCFTDENIKNGTAPKPPVPISGAYTMFGSKFETDEDILRPLESQGIPRLYPRSEKFDHLVEMKKLNHSIVINFLEMLDIIIESPSSQERIRKIEDINVLFINLHHLINEFRPHQARETLRVMLHRQKAQRLETAEKLDQHVEKAKTLLKTCNGILNSLKFGQTEGQNDLLSAVHEADTEMACNDDDDEWSRAENLLCGICDNL